MGLFVNTEKVKERMIEEDKMMLSNIFLPFLESDEILLEDNYLFQDGKGAVRICDKKTEAKGHKYARIKIDYRSDREVCFIVADDETNPLKYLDENNARKFRNKKYYSDHEQLMTVQLLYDNYKVWYNVFHNPSIDNKNAAKQSIANFVYDDRRAKEIRNNLTTL